MINSVSVRSSFETGWVWITILFTFLCNIYLQIEKGELRYEDDYDYVVVTVDMAPDISPIRKLLGENYPDKKKGMWWFQIIVWLAY